MGSWLLAVSVAAAIEPVPVVGDPSPVVVTAFEIPPPDVAWITAEDVFEYPCSVDVAAAADGALTVTPVACPEPMVAAARDAAGKWVVQGGPSTFRVLFLARYNPVVRAITVHAQVDPGLEVAMQGVRGPAGLKLVHPAVRVRDVAPKIPKKLAADAAGATCEVHVWLDDLGRPQQAEVAQCPATLHKAVGAAALKWRYTPRFVDGSPVPITLMESVALAP